MQLTVIGCGNAFNSGERFHSCYLLDTDSGRLMIDCGANAPYALKKAGIDSSSIDAVLISHCHGDHFGGLPFLYLDHLFLNLSSKHIQFFGPEGFRKRFQTLMDCMYPKICELPRQFDYVFKELRPKTPAQWRNLSIECHEVSHYAGENTPSLAVSITDGSKRFAYSGDSGWCDNVIAAGKDADLYVIECSTYTPKSDMHLDYSTLSEKFDDIEAKRYVLTHMGNEMLASLDKIDKSKCIPAEDGLVLKV